MKTNGTLCQLPDLRGGATHQFRKAGARNAPWSAAWEDCLYIYDKLVFSIIVVLRKRNCACPDCVPLHNFFVITQHHMGLSKISLPVLDAFESSSASILSLRLGFLDKSNLLKIPDCPAVDLCHKAWFRFLSLTQGKRYT